MSNNQYFLPVESLSIHAIEWIEQIKNLIDAVRGDCLTNNLSTHLIFFPEYDAINDIASIEKGKDDLFHICISLNFCQYLWSVGLYLSVNFDNKIQIPMMNMADTNNHNYEANENEVSFANDIFFDGRKLLYNFYKDLYWRKPNIVFPEPYKGIIERANGIYCAAIAFIYAHEFSHNFLGHTHILNTYTHSIQDEMNADATAMSFIQDVFNTNRGFTFKAGIATVLSSLLLMSENSISGNGSHPDMDIRIKSLMNALSLSEMDNLWGYMAVAVRIWLLVFNGITVQEDKKQKGFDTHKDMYEYYLDKLKEVRQAKFAKKVSPIWDI
jgi:hypothetical protein